MGREVDEWESGRLTTYTFEASTKAVMPFICSLTVDSSSQKAVDLVSETVVMKTVHEEHQ